jgi:hypothetical protein
MVSPIKSTSAGAPEYSAVPNAEGSPSLDQSPNPNRGSVGYDDSLLSPNADTHMLRPQSGTYPAPSIISSRNNRDSVLSTPLDNRSSWGSNLAFAAAGAGAAVCPFSLTLLPMLISRDDPLPLEVNPTYNTSLLDGTIPMMIDEYPKKTMELDTSPPLLLLLELLP